MFIWITNRNGGKKSGPSKSRGKPRIVRHANKNATKDRTRKRVVKPKTLSGLAAYARMLMSPCDAPLVSGLHGTASGYLQRTKSLVTLTQTTAAPSNTCGYIIWCPRYFSPGTGLAPGSSARLSMNCFLWQSSDPQLKPLNTAVYDALLAANPPVIGLARSTGGQWTSSQFIPDPASGFASGTVCEDARLLSSCIRMTYTGRQSDAAGIICPIRNLSLTDIIQRNDATGTYSGQGLSVSDLFRLSPTQERLGTEVHEIRSRDSDNELDEWQTFLDPAVYPGSFAGAGGSITTMDPGISPREPMCYGFAWRDVEATQFARMYVELYKNFEWRPKSSAGISLPVEERTSALSNVPKAMQYLDRVKHGWDIARPIIGKGMALAAAVQGLVYGTSALQIGGGVAGAFTGGRPYGNGRR